MNRENKYCISLVYLRKSSEGPTIISTDSRLRSVYLLARSKEEAIGKAFEHFKNEMSSGFSLYMTDIIEIPKINKIIKIK